MSEERRIGWLPKIVGGLGLAALLKSLERSQRNTAIPEIFSGDPKIQALADTAWSLANEGIDDEAAVIKLKSAARGRSVDLSRAAAIVRHDAAGESRSGHRANALLKAAESGEPVIRETAEEAAWFDRVEELDRLPAVRAFEVLAEVAPDLRAVHSRLVEAAAAAGEPPFDDETNGDLFEAISIGLEPIVGPKSTNEDPLLRTWTAYGLARVHIAEQLGLTFSD